MNAKKVALHRIVRGSFRKIRIFLKKQAKENGSEQKKERFFAQKLDKIA